MRVRLGGLWEVINRVVCFAFYVLEGCEFDFGFLFGCA